MANDFFRDIGTSIFKPVGDFISGGVTALQPGRVQQMQSLLESEAGRTLMNKSRAAAMDRGEGLYGGGGSEVSKLEQIKTLAFSLEKITDEDLEKEIRRHIKSLLDEIKKEGKKTDNRDRFSGGGGFVGPPAPADYFQQTKKAPTGIGPPAPTGKPRPGEIETSKSAAEYFQQTKKAPIPKSPDIRPGDITSESNRTFPGASAGMTFPYTPPNTPPKTFPQLGVESIADQATLQEMQKAMPDVDMKAEYEDAQKDPRRKKVIDGLIKRWREDKSKRDEIIKAFSVLQQKAQQTLGLA